MATHAVIAAFRRLHTNDARREAVDALLAELTTHERRALHTAAALCFHCDLVARLPLELVAHVFAQLDPSTPFRLQRVSRPWQRVLRSPHVLRNSLLSAGAPDLPAADYAVLQRHAKHLHAFRHAKPNHCLAIALHTQRPASPVLVRDTLVWSARTAANHDDSRVLYLFDISTCTLHTLHGEARETIQHVVASERIVAFTSSNSTLCYVADLQARNRKKFRVSSPALFQALACRESSVACAGLLQDHALVYIWNYDTQQGTSFRIDFGTHLLPYPRHGHQHRLALLLQPQHERILVFTDQPSPSLPSGGKHMRTIIYSQYTYTGDCIFSSQMALDHVDHLSYSTFQTPNNTFFPVDSQGKFRVMIGSRHLHTAACWLQFDERPNMFTEPRPSTHPGQMYTSSHLSWWNDTFFSSEILPHDDASSSDQSDQARVSVLTQLGTIHGSEDKPLLLFRHGPCVALDATVDPFAIVANDKYVVRTLTNSFHILCYQTSPDWPSLSGNPDSAKHGRFFDMGVVSIVDSPHMPHLI
ncbi:hypothetical protein BDU57DRAFT_38592 [Ampelomyces quisqualis]|uniref:F-box domain-containing protein n=1 Tax=Ampelomyces quisqualis TaxID=50730 RepID=A0A6A5R0D7_AMPQU|nr:hypothetical protein BDU57DRAFT_38592 [Ampelomyces quisqualis]